MSRRLEKRIEKVVAITVVLLCIFFCGLILIFWAIFEIPAGQNLTKIQAALDETCGVGVVVAERRYYDHEFSGYYSPQASCFVGAGEYSCECRLTPSPTALVTQTPRD